MDCAWKITVKIETTIKFIMCIICVILSKWNKGFRVSSLYEYFFMNTTSFGLQSLPNINYKRHVINADC